MSDPQYHPGVFVRRFTGKYLRTVEHTVTHYEFCFISSNNGSMKIKDCKLYNLYHFADGSYQELEVTNSEFILAVIFLIPTGIIGKLKEIQYNISARRTLEKLTAKEEENHG